MNGLHRNLEIIIYGDLLEKLVSLHILFICDSDATIA